MNAADNTILVVDDDDHVRRSLRRILERQGYNCLEAADVPTARELLQQQPVGLVLSDVNMPDESGLDLVKHLQPRLPETAIVMVTSVDSTRTAVQALEEGAYGYVLKPFDRKEILIQVANALRRRALELFQRRSEDALRDRVRAQTVKVLQSREELALRLASACASRTDETQEHIRRLGLYCAELGQALGWMQDEIEDFRVAATLHDVGKVSLPDRIINKPEPLAPDEHARMQQHTVDGAAMLAGSEIPMLEVAEQVARSHHERWDGTGYPDGLAGDAIPIEARIVAIVDSYDSMLHDRSFRPRWNEQLVVEHLRDQRGKAFDPELLDLFLENLPLMRAIRLGNPDG